MAFLEVLVAMLVFALALLPLIKLQVLSMNATKAGFYKTETAAAAESVMDYLMTDLKDVFEGRWDNVTVVSGDNQTCGHPTPQQKVICDVLNTNNGRFHAQNNAVICVFGKRPQDFSKKNRDQYLISIRAIWYSDKRQESEKGHRFYDQDLSAAACGKNYDDDSAMKTITQNENIDSIKINMAY